MTKATFGAGCFWHVEETFSKLKGITKTTVGYEGGSTNNPTYTQVCTDTTGHAEVCEIEYNPKKIKYEDILNTFWKIHDPTQLNRQGPDVGTQYRSIIFYHSAKQKETAINSMKKQQKKTIKKIMTKIILAEKFWKAEEYHQKYFKKNGATCGINF